MNREEIEDRIEKEVNRGAGASHYVMDNILHKRLLRISFDARLIQSRISLSVNNRISDPINTYTWNQL